MTDVVLKWQKQLDTKFPNGAVASWDEPGNTTYLVPRICVTGAQGLDPELWLPVFSGSDKVLGPWRMVGWHVLQDSPYRARAVIDGTAPGLLLTAAVPSRAARAMRPERQRLIQAAPDGGPALLHGEEAAG